MNFVKGSPVDGRLIGSSVLLDKTVVEFNINVGLAVVFLRESPIGDALDDLLPEKAIDGLFEKHLALSINVTIVGLLGEVRAIVGLFGELSLIDGLSGEFKDMIGLCGTGEKAENLNEVSNVSLLVSIFERLLDILVKDAE